MRTGRVGQVRAAVALSLTMAACLTFSTGVAIAAPAPPPPNPSDSDLSASQSDIAAKAGEIGRLTGRLADLQGQVDTLEAKLSGQRELANKALVDMQSAQDAAAAANQRADNARIETDAAASAIDTARIGLDNFAASAYEQGLNSGSLGLLTAATSPDDLVARAQLTDLIAQQQLAALDSLQRARVAKANADSAARAARDDAVAKQGAAEHAKQQADSAVATAQQAAVAEAANLTNVNNQVAGVQQQLDAAQNRDAGLRAERQRYLGYQAQLAAQQAAQDRAAQQAAAGRVGGGAVRVGGGGVRAPVGGGIQQVIDRALSQLGVTYAWGGGTGSGPSRGVRDGGVADAFGDFRKVGFDCSGLMIYAFAAAGISLPHYSGYQYTAGKQVPVSAMKPGDMLFWADGGLIHHVALYIGGGRMIEAPFSGSSVRISPVRYGGGLLPFATRLLG